MTPIYAQEELLNDKAAIFLAGPSPRSNDVLSWRKAAIEYFERINFDGYVYIPEPRDGKYPENYIEQIEWEAEGLEKANCILFWIPRNLETLPGFTTNDEWGYWKAKAPEKLVLGFPEGAPKVKYQEYYAKKLRIPIANSLELAIEYAILRGK